MSSPDLMQTVSRAQRRHNTNRGRKFPPDPIAVEDIVRLFEACQPLTSGWAAELSALRLRALIAVLWRTGLRISEALALEERDLIRHDMALIVRHGKGDKRRVVAMDEWGWRELEHWMAERASLPPGVIFCVVRGRSAGREPFSDTDTRRQLRDAALRAG